MPGLTRTGGHLSSPEEGLYRGWVEGVEAGERGERNGLGERRAHGGAGRLVEPRERRGLLVHRTHAATLRIPGGHTTIGMYVQQFQIDK